MDSPSALNYAARSELPRFSSREDCRSRLDRTMDLPPPRFMAAHGVLGLPALLPRDPGLDEALIGALRQEFPNVVLRQPPLAAMPNEGPRIVLASTSSQLVISPNQADFEVRFYGEYPSDPDQCLGYLHRKMEAVRQGFAAVDLLPANIGVVANLRFNFDQIDESPVAHILDTHLRTRIDAQNVEDAVARLALKVRDKYFVSLRVANYEARVVQRPVMLGDIQPMIVKPWEGTVEDAGVLLTVDINNVLENKVVQEDAEVTADGLANVIELLKQVASTAGPQFVETGEVSMDVLVGEAA
jgi:hypothetical protein